MRVHCVHMCCMFIMAMCITCASGLFGLGKINDPKFSALEMQKDLKG